MVNTTADEHRDSALSHVQQAIENLTQVVAWRCDGYEEFSNEYADIMRQAMNQLIEIRNALDRR